MKSGIIRGLLGAMVISLTNQVHGQLEPDFETQVTLKVRDDRGVPVVGAEAVLGFLHNRRKDDLSIRGMTDADGRFKASGKVVDSLRFSVRKEGYYSLSKRRALIRMDVDMRKVEEIAFPLVIRKRIAPVGLYARRVSTAIPEFGQWVGFSLQNGDWQIGGNGDRESDILFRFSRKMIGLEKSRYSKGELLERLKRVHAPGESGEGRFPHLIKFYGKERYFTDDELIEHSLGKWKSRLEIKFPGEKEGIVVVEGDYLPYCELKMPHLAYESGYKPEWVWTKESGVTEEDEGERGYFLRTRVKLDAAGEIISAHYAKIIEEIRIDPRGRLEFAYVFNATANDRNLEFDPAKNLFGKLPMEEEVQSP